MIYSHEATTEVETKYLCAFLLGIWIRACDQRRCRYFPMRRKIYDIFIGYNNMDVRLINLECHLTEKVIFAIVGVLRHERDGKVR